MESKYKNTTPESKYKNKTDETLVSMAQRGDLEAEEHLIRIYKDVVRGKAGVYFITGADSDDVVQEGMIGLFKAIRSYDASKETSFHTFAELCITRQIITAIKTAGRMKHTPLNTSLSLNRSAPGTEQEENLEETLSSGSDSDPGELMVLKDITRHILSKDSKIFSPLEMQVLGEYLQGKSNQEIAKSLGKTKKAVDNAMQRTKKKTLHYIWQ